MFSYINSEISDGGIIYLYVSNIIILNNIISNYSQAWTRGGVIYINLKNKIYINGCLIQESKATFSEGGILYALL